MSKAAKKIELVNETKIKIESIIAMRKSHESMMKRMRKIEASLKEAEKDVLGYIVDNGPITGTGYSVAVQIISRRVPKWREEFVARLGDTLAQQVVENTAPTVSQKLVIST